MTLLVTGGAGYIGSHTCIELIKAGFDVVVIDNLCNSKQESLVRVEKIVQQKITFYNGNILDRPLLRKIFDSHTITGVIHFAGLKSVNESCEEPIRYYLNNVSGTLVLCELMAEYNIHHILFSSSATVYGDPDTVPITESSATCAVNPYGRSKLMVEEVLRDLCKVKDNQWRITLLRYFNPIGAHHSGLIGEDPQGIPNNLMPYIAQVASGKLSTLKVFGDDYPTHDGTGVRDYIHVVDLARGHVMALQKLMDSEPNCYVYNLGTGNGYSVLEMLNAFAAVSGKEIPYEITHRRPGDIATCFADVTLAANELGWKAEFDLSRMAEDTWRWQKNNPNGYE